MNFSIKPNRMGRPCGTTLIELMMAVGVGSLVMAVVMALSFYSSRSFVAMGNYVTLNQDGREAVDRMLRDIRQATNVVSFQTNMPMSLALAYSDGSTVTYTWSSNSTSSTLTQTKNGTTSTLLPWCDLWNFNLCKRVPIPNTTNLFYPATNLSGAIDVTQCKLIDMSWKCSRTIFGKKANTENVQTAQIVLRNH